MGECTRHYRCSIGMSFHNILEILETVLMIIGAYLVVWAIEVSDQWWKEHKFFHDIDAAYAAAYGLTMQEYHLRFGPYQPHFLG
jgi:hypothetical protein